MRELLGKIYNLKVENFDYWNATYVEKNTLVNHIYNIVDHIAFDNGIGQLTYEYDLLWQTAHQIAIDCEEYVLAEIIWTAMKHIGIPLENKVQ
jgi:hypothetical protein